jgi:proteasome accessory factor C
VPPYTPDQLMEIIVDDEEVIADLGADLARPRRLTASEGFALAASARAIAAVPGSDPDGALAGALAKLESTLGGRGLLRIDIPEPAQLTLVRDAATRGAQLELRYYSASSDRESTRVVDPVAVLAIEGVWYLDGFCHNAQGMRRFRVDRILDGRLTGGTSPPRADSASPSSDAYVPGPEATLAHVAIDAGALWIVDAVPTLSLEPMPDGRTNVGIGVASTVWFDRLLLRLGPHAEVLDPPELADVGRQAATRLLARYRH